MRPGLRRMSTVLLALAPPLWTLQTSLRPVCGSWQCQLLCPGNGLRSLWDVQAGATRLGHLHPLTGCLADHQPAVREGWLAPGPCWETSQGLGVLPAPLTPKPWLRHWRNQLTRKLN